MLPEKAVEPNSALKETVITEEDYQPAEQGSSTDSRYTSVVSEDSDEGTISDKAVFLSFKDYQGLPKFKLIDQGVELFEAIKIPTKTAELVHNQPLKQSEGKFLIVDVLSETEKWTGYDEDRHSINSFIAWDLPSAKRDDDERR